MKPTPSQREKLQQIISENNDITAKLMSGEKLTEEQRAALIAARKAKKDEFDKMSEMIDSSNSTLSRVKRPVSSTDEIDPNTDLPTHVVGGNSYSLIRGMATDPENEELDAARKVRATGLGVDNPKDSEERRVSAAATRKQMEYENAGGNVVHRNIGQLPEPSIFSKYFKKKKP